MNRSRVFRTRSLVTFARRQVRNCGFVIVDRNKIMNLSDVVDFLQEKNISISTVFDIGAYVGNWTREISSILKFEAEIVQFEPNSIHLKELNKTGARVLNVLLNDKTDLVDFYSIGGTGDSIYKENSEHYGQVEPIQVQSKMLDDVVLEYNLNYPQLIKIDVQGAEMAVLHGGKETLRNALAVIIECQLLKRNIGGSQVSDVLKFMDSMDFVPLAIMEIHQIDFVIQELDFIFVRKSLLR